MNSGISELVPSIVECFSAESEIESFGPRDEGPKSSREKFMRKIRGIPRREHYSSRRQRSQKPCVD